MMRIKKPTPSSWRVKEIKKKGFNFFLKAYLFQSHNSFVFRNKKKRIQPLRMSALSVQSPPVAGEDICWICHSDDEKAPMYCFCNCTKGVFLHAHEECLASWIRTMSGASRYCRSCGKTYETKKSGFSLWLTLRKWPILLTDGPIPIYMFVVGTIIQATCLCYHLSESVGVLFHLLVFAMMALEKLGLVFLSRNPLLPLFALVATFFFARATYGWMDWLILSLFGFKRVATLNDFQSAVILLNIAVKVIYEIRDDSLLVYRTISVKVPKCKSV